MYSWTNSWLFSTNSLPLIYLFSRVQSVVVTDLMVKLLYRSRAGSHFYRTEYEIWADFGLVGNTEKNISGRL